MVVQKCEPLSGMGCDDGQTCTIVETLGTSDNLVLVATCDTVGTGVAGDSCETEQCKAGFACLGKIGSRTCQQLCDSSNSCEGSATCNMTQISNIGVNIGVCTGS